MMFAVLTILYGQLMGMGFGINEVGIKAGLKTSAGEVIDTVYQGDKALALAVGNKSWTYMKRAHLHAGGMGTTAVALIIMMCLYGKSRRLISVASKALGVGGLGYSVAWMWAGFRAPALGSTGLAKESLEWLAVPSAGLFILGSLAAFGVLIVEIVTAYRGRAEQKAPATPGD